MIRLSLHCPLTANPLQSASAARSELFSPAQIREFAPLRQIGDGIPHKQDDLITDQKGMGEPLALVSTRSDFRTQSQTLCSRLFPAALSIFSIATLTLVLSSSVSAQDQTVTGGPCASGVSAEIENRPPSFFLFGLENFEAYVKNAFPVGSSEARLVLWLDAKGFGKVQTGSLDVAFADEPDETERLSLRLAQGTSANLRVLKRPGLISWSYYSMGWNADQCGRLVEVYPDQELNQMDLP